MSSVQLLRQLNSGLRALFFDTPPPRSRITHRPSHGTFFFSPTDRVSLPSTFMTQRTEPDDKNSSGVASSSPLSDYEYWVFAEVALCGYMQQGKKKTFGRLGKGDAGVFWAVLSLRMRSTLHVVKLCTCPRMVGYELVFCCQFMPACFSSISRKMLSNLLAFLYSIRICFFFLSQCPCLQSSSLVGRPNEWARNRWKEYSCLLL